MTDEFERQAADREGTARYEWELAGRREWEKIIHQQTLDIIERDRKIVELKNSLEQSRTDMTKAEIETADRG